MMLHEGKGTVEIEDRLLEGRRFETILPGPAPPVADPGEALRKALDHPCDAEPLRGWLRRGTDVGIVVPDHTRSAGVTEILPHLLAFLVGHGARREGIRILIGGGGHRAMKPEEIVRHLGASVEGLAVEQHDAASERGHVAVGKTSRGTPVEIDARFVRPGLRIVLGGVGLHYFAGFTGGRKGIFPGLASRRGILENHRLALWGTGEGRYLHPRCAPGELDGNPVHEDMVEAARRSRDVFFVNAVLNAEGRIAEIFAGEMEAAHRAATRLAGRLFLTGEAGAYDFAIASAGGEPFDSNFIQAHKAVDHAARYVRNGGRILVFLECAEGIGSDGFLERFEPDAARMAEAIRKDYTMNAHTALSMKEKTRRLTVLLHTALPDATVARMGAVRAASPAAGIEALLDGLSRDARGLLLPLAGKVAPEPPPRHTGVPAEGGRDAHPARGGTSGATA